MTKCEICKTDKLETDFLKPFARITICKKCAGIEGKKGYKPIARYTSKAVLEVIRRDIINNPENLTYEQIAQINSVKRHDVNNQARYLKKIGAIGQKKQPPRQRYADRLPTDKVTLKTVNKKKTDSIIRDIRFAAIGAINTTPEKLIEKHKIENSVLRYCIELFKKTKFGQRFMAKHKYLRISNTRK